LGHPGIGADLAASVLHPADGVNMITTAGFPVKHLENDHSRGTGDNGGKSQSYQQLKQGKAHLVFIY